MVSLLNRKINNSTNSELFLSDRLDSLIDLSKFNNVFTTLRSLGEISIDFFK